ncbi:MAG: CoA-binding protein [Dehalococcoidia bacterium]
MLGERAETFAELEPIFHPRAIAVVGASSRPESQGYDYVRCLLDHGYRGPIYPVNPNLDEVLGVKAYPSLRDVPGPVDYVISCIPASGVLDVMEDCRHKGVKAIHLFTGRFSETGREDAARLEQELLRRAREAGVRIIGPNCMGLYYPREGISFRTNFPREAGSIGFLSQSGGNAVELIYHGALRGLRFSKVISYGNALDLNEVDFFDYFARDPETRVIAAYIEGVSDGRRSLAALRCAAARKPVIVLKGGRTGAGTRAAASHTAALAGAGQIWSAAIRQAGALEVSDLEEAMDMLVSFAFLRPGVGLRVGVVGGGGGRTVQSADLCEEAGLTVLPFPVEIRQAVREQAPEVCDWLSNPVDQSILGGFPVGGADILDMMAESPHYDLLIANVGEDWPLGRPGGEAMVLHVVDRFIDASRRASKPLGVVLGSADSPEERRWQTMVEARERLVDAGVAVYPSIGRAARAMVRFTQYCREHGEGRQGE